MIIARVSGSGELYGYGWWRHAEVRFTTGTPPPGFAPARFIRIESFGVAEQYHGERTASGISAADQLYARLETAAREDPASDESMVTELFCDVSNVRAQAFWRRQGFRDIGPATGNEAMRRMLRI